LRESAVHPRRDNLNTTSGIVLTNLEIAMALDMFINMGDKIKGESRDSVRGPKGDIDVLAWSWGMSQSGTTHTGGGGGEDRLTENVTLNFAKVTYGYTAQKADGKMDGVKQFKWNIAENAAF
jgi:type VI protein secretion system component Hcp